jgi:NAD(P)-dependent dehydrogenase (short-subunit alcohol dehydrogenase family)
MGSLNNKVAVITGGTRGLGLAMAQAYAREGAAMVIASRSVRSVDQALHLLKQQGAQVDGLACDVSDRAQVQALADRAVQVFGRFDIWVNNAGLGAPYGPSAAVPADRFEAVLQTNIWGNYYGSIAAMQHFVPRGSGKLINLLGRGDSAPVPLQNAYASSKAWLKNFTLALAKEYRTSGVGVYAFNPGLVLTDMLSNLEAVAGYETQMNPLRFVTRLWANPPEVPAQKAVWIASAATDGKTGLQVRVLTPRFMLTGLLREAARRVTGRAEPIEPLQVKVVPSAIPIKIED